MGKLKNSAIKWGTSILALITSLIIGGLFAVKTTVGLPILKYIPAFVHPIVGWALIAIGLIQFIIVLVLAIAKAVK